MGLDAGRRGFLKGAATAAAFLPGFRIIGDDAHDGAAGAIGVAMIGWGAEGRVLSASLVRIPGIRVCAICDIWNFQRQQAAAFFRGYGMKVATYEDYREMLEKEGDRIDAVIVATPDWMHCEHTCACLRAGKHVYCEKEMSNRLEEAAEMCRVQKETGKFLQIGHQRRSNPRYRHCFERVIPEMLGRVTTAYAQWNRTLAPFFAVKRPPKSELLKRYGYENAEQYLNWRWFRKYGGGSMVDLGSHQIDLFFWAWGVPPSSVTAIGGKDAFEPAREMFDRMYCIYEFKMPDGTKNEAMYQVISSNSRGGFYEQFMGVNASLTIAEISACGNAVQRELRDGGFTEAQWQEFIEKGLILPSDSDKIKKESTDDVAVDTRISVQAAGNALAVETNKPAHMPHLENFFDACRGDAELNCPAELAYESAVAVLAANRSAEEGKTVFFKPEEFKVPPRIS